MTRWGRSVSLPTETELFVSILHAGCQHSSLSWSDSLWPRDSSPPGSSVHGILQTGHWSGWPLLLQGLFPVQASDLYLAHGKQILYKPSRQRSPRVVVCYHHIIVLRFRNGVSDSALWEWLLLEENGLQSKQWLSFRSRKIPGGLMNKLRTGSIASLTIPPSDLNLLTNQLIMQHFLLIIITFMQTKQLCSFSYWNTVDYKLCQFQLHSKMI